jgi:hypothetical protein
VGGLWASFEIVIGSFLHNMHLPFSGTILTFFSTILMIAFYQVWPERGLIWRAGLICALMKSVSPSAVILGPMTGIMLEALLVDLILRTMGNNPAGLLLAGLFSQLSALLHKAGSLLILYGLDIVRIYENIFEFAIRQFKNLDVSPVQAVTGLILIYCLLGIIAALTGYRIARKIPAQSHEVELRHGKLAPDTGWDKPASGQRFHVLLLILHLLILPVFLFFMNRLGFHPLAIALYLAYIIYCLAWYRRIKYRLMKPVFWIHILFLGVLAGFFWESPDPGTAATGFDSWIIGGSLILRAILVITGFSALSTELRNPALKQYLFRYGFRKIYNAVSMAFSALPLMLERGISGKAFLANPIRALRRTILDAEEWLHVFQQETSTPG